MFSHCYWKNLKDIVTIYQISRERRKSISPSFSYFGYIGALVTAHQFGPAWASFLASFRGMSGSFPASFPDPGPENWPENCRTPPGSWPKNSPKLAQTGGLLLRPQYSQPIYIYVTTPTMLARDAIVQTNKHLAYTESTFSDTSEPLR